MQMLLKNSVPDSQKTRSLHYNVLPDNDAVAQWLRYCARNQKIVGSIPDGVMNFSLT
jgi:hypothetical protein